MTQTPDAVARIVQLALTPIFFLAGLATLLNVFTVRLGRVADRVDKFMAEPDGHARQLRRLRLRSKLLDAAVLLGALSGALTCAAAFTLFLGAIGKVQAGDALLALFGAALACAILALAVFAIETVLSGITVREESRGQAGD